MKPYDVRPRRRRRARRRGIVMATMMMASCLMVLVGVVVVAIFSAEDARATATDDERAPDERASACGEEGGSCYGSGGPSSSSGTSSEGTLTISRDGTTGTTTILAQSYPASGGGYGYKISRHVNRIHGGAALSDRLEAQSGEILSGSGSKLGDANAIRQTVFDISTTLAHELLSLALIHREEWMQALMEPPLDYDDDDDEGRYHEDKQQLAFAADHFDKASNAYEALLSVYSQLWRAMQAENLRRTFSVYDHEAIAGGQSSAYLQLADLFHQRYNAVPDEATSGDCSAAYRHLIQSEHWANVSVKLLGIDLGEGSGDSGDDENETNGGTTEGSAEGAHEAGHDAIVIEAKETMAVVWVRQGALLVDMYATGYVLDADGNLRLLPPETIERENAEHRTIHQLGEDSKRILHLALDKMSQGSLLYSRLARGGGGRDYRLSVADTHHYAGTLYGHLFRWGDAAKELEASVLLYDELFDQYLGVGMVDEALGMTSGMVQTTQSLFEAYSNLHGKTEQAKDVFRKHLALRRYSERQVPIEYPFSDDDDDVDAYYSNHQDGDYGDHDATYQSFGSVANSQYDEELKTYRATLNEYLQQQNGYGRDGSYYEMEFDVDGGYGSYVQHDKIYEGSLRSGIGSLLLAQNKHREAEGELGLAVGLLRDGLGEDGRDTFETYGEDSMIVDYSVRLELANALLNLAYARLGLGMWRASYEAYEEAMDLYGSELREGETPLDHSGGSEGGHQTGWGERLSRFFKDTMGVGDAAKVGGDGDNAEKTIIEDGESGQYINIDNYQMTENSTTMNMHY